MVKHTQAIRGPQLTNCLSVFDHSVGLALKGLSLFLLTYVEVLFIKNEVIFSKRLLFELHQKS